ncbi:glutathione transport system permease protein GsiC [Oxobacter pfennigii]|uniref:Glutathione transport system permease protein GsiC n=1 Tax=Oxobacter pfennigii TaxID=36849 RepID=A0A0P8W454_9CLOT|nr:ABC transporter permease [Oxobacter pfennigii]KPU42417.1 glutathione transport system permease protein GsiC [Oxobacter pfennigii]
MLNYIIKRLIQLIPVLIGVSIVVFLMIYLIPGDAAEIIGGPAATADEVANIRIKLGLDRPMHEQYLRYMSGVLKGDLGFSFQTGQPVSEAIKTRYVNTFKLAVFSAVVAAIIGVCAGIIAAVKQNSWFDYLCMSVATLGISAPTFWIGLMLIIVFCVKFKIFTISGFTGQIWTKEGLKGMVLPAVTLGFNSAAMIARMTRSSVLEIIHQDYIHTARAKGLSEKIVVLKHALKNSLIPIVTVIGVNFGSLLGGTVVVESVFAINGIGRLMVQAINARDFPMVQGAVLIVATTFVLVNLITDIIYAAIDPRISYK